MGQGVPGTVLPYLRGSTQGSGSAWLGVTLQRSAAAGAVIDGIVAGGPADQGGLRPDDVIVAIDNRSVGSPEEVINRVDDLNAGQTVNVRVRRGSTTFTTQVTLGTRSGAYSTP
jgi:S1-C subfamily serine protease